MFLSSLVVYSSSRWLGAWAFFSARSIASLSSFSAVCMYIWLSHSHHHSSRFINLQPFAAHSMESKEMRGTRKRIGTGNESRLPWDNDYLLSHELGATSPSFLEWSSSEESSSMNSSPTWTWPFTAGVGFLSRLRFRHSHINYLYQNPLISCFRIHRQIK